MDVVPDSPPEMAPLKLITMVVESFLDANINLDVIARYTVLDNHILGISYRNIYRGISKPKAKNKVKHSDDCRVSMAKDIFKNQCTFIINVGDKNINSKLFNNGKMVHAGCKTTEHARQATEILRNKLMNMKGLVKYVIPNELQCKDVKKFFKDELRKKYGRLFIQIAQKLELSMNMDIFTDMPADKAYIEFINRTGCQTYLYNLLYILTIINILKCYYPISVAETEFNSSSLQELLDIIINNTVDGEISYEFLSYINNTEPINFNPATVKPALINQSTNCGYYVKREALKSLMDDMRPDTEPSTGVIRCSYDKNKYPGVIIVYRTKTKDVKIIVFNTGKINITATKTQEQVDEAYRFISDLCREHFSTLLLVCEYHNRARERDDKLPNQFHVGEIEGQQYYLLKKSSIISNPRNIRFLKQQGLLGNYL